MESELQSWGWGLSAFLRLMLSGFQSWGQIGWAAWDEPFGCGLSARIGFPRLCATVLPSWLPESSVPWPSSEIVLTRKIYYQMGLFGVFGVPWRLDLAGWYTTHWNHSTSITKQLQCTVESRHRCDVCYWSLHAQQNGAQHVQSLGRNMQAEASSDPLLTSKIYALFLYFELSFLHVGLASSERHCSLLIVWQHLTDHCCSCFS